MVGHPRHGEWASVMRAAPVRRALVLGWVFWGIAQAQAQAPAQPLLGDRAAPPPTFSVQASLGPAYRSLPPLLPAPELVQAALLAQPAVQQAHNAKKLASAEQQKLNSGSYEWSVRAGLQQRLETPMDGAARQHYLDSEIGLERSLRWPNKAKTDVQLGQLGHEASDLALGDAWHQAALHLFRDWLEAMRGVSAHARLQEQTKLGQAQLEVARRREKAGEASRLEVMLAESELTRLQVAYDQADQRSKTQIKALLRRYPGLVAPTSWEMPIPAELPELPEPAPEAWAQALLAGDHQLKLAQAEVMQFKLRSQRASQDKVADPLVGMRLARERNSQDQLFGVYIQIPLGGSYRSAEEGAALARLDMAIDREAEIRLQVETEAHRVSNAVWSSSGLWRQQLRLKADTKRNADLALTAYSLGELPLSEAMQARRVSIEAALASDSAALDFYEAQGQLLINCHELWAEPSEH